MVIGIFGKSGSGKSTVCEYLKKKGFFGIDGDKLGHKVLEKGSVGYKKVIEAFGNEFLLPNGDINRKKLGKFVFENKKADVLSEITHPVIEDMILSEINNFKNTHNNIVIDAALLCNTKIKDMCDTLVLIKSDKCCERIIKRDNIELSDAKNRLDSQNISDTADEIVENNGTMEELFSEIDRIIRKD